MFTLSCGRGKLCSECVQSYSATHTTCDSLPPLGDIERDFWLSLDLLKSTKDHAEFVVVRDWIRDALAPCVQEVDVEVPKSVLKQVRVKTGTGVRL